MTVKIVRMLNGEDVIAEVQEAYPDKEHYSPIGYMLTNPYQITIDCTAETMFADSTSSDPQKINDLQLELFPWIPLTQDETIPIPADWLITLVEPVTKLKEMYIEDIVNNGNQSNSTDNNTADSD